MSVVPRDWRRILVSVGLTCAVCLVAVGCGDSLVNSGAAHPGKSPDRTAVPGRRTGG